jgi:hypothetical protein
MHEQRHVVRGSLAAHDGLVVRDDEPARPQQRRQDRVELKAVAAAAVGADPGDQRRLVQRAHLPELDGEILVRHAVQVRPVELVQAVDIRAGHP